MKELLDPTALRSLRDRGKPRLPDGVDRFIDGRPGVASTRGPFPHGRFWLWMELWCPNLATKRDDDDRYDFVDLQVLTLYRGILPWLAYAMGDAAGIQRGIDFVDLVDEFMDHEYEYYRFAARWPLPEVIEVFAAVLTTLQAEPVWGTITDRDAKTSWSIEARDELAQSFARVAGELRQHETCCTDARINVHWW